LTSPKQPIVTCIGACNGIGQTISPFLIFKGKRLNEEIKDGCSPGCGFAVSENGWSSSKLFTLYLQEHFIKYCNKPENQDILILFDGSTTHLGREAIDWAKERNIHLFVLPPHSSHILQPLDIGVFGPMKQSYNSRCHTFLKQNKGQIVSKHNITSIICKAYMDAFKPSNIVNSFEKSGIFPFNAGKIDPKNFKPSEALKRKYENEENITAASKETINIDYFLKRSNDTTTEINKYGH
jgi:hypothetical protein